MASKIDTNCEGETLTQLTHVVILKLQIRRQAVKFRGMVTVTGHCSCGQRLVVTWGTIQGSPGPGIEIGTHAG